MVRSIDHRDLSAERTLAAKGSRSVSVVLPALDEAATIAAIVRALPRPLVDEVLVVDDSSSDATVAAATEAGARVIASPGRGKGRAMWTGVRESAGDIVVFCDADVRDFGPHYVERLVGPLVCDDTVAFVKAWYDRSFDGRPGEGGRVTELAAKPLLRVLFPALADLRQPLSGECAGRRAAFEEIPFVEGWGVDIGLVLDMAARFGTGAIAQVDLGSRLHRNRPLAELGPQAEAIMRTVLYRAGVGDAVAECPALATITRRDRRTA